MFKTILLPLDGTPEAASVLPMVRALARAHQAELVLVRVTANHRDATEHVAAGRYLDDAVRDHDLGDLRVRIEVRSGDVAEQILATAQQAGADLLTLATHGRQGLARAWFGSVSERVLAASPVPVLVLRADSHPATTLRTLLVPVDNTPGSVAALAVARDLATLPHARLHLLQVIAPLPRWGEGWDISPSWEEEVRSGAQTFLDQLAARLHAKGAEASGEAVIGPIAETIGRVARERDADLIVMSTHALTGPRRALLGSVADAVVRTAGLPVLLIRQDAADQSVGSPNIADDAGATP